ncbi:MAG: hypothetical protein AAB521_01220 [Patescibacteria group bacterium]
MKNNSKFLLLCLEERNGEYEYSHRSVHILPNNRIATANRLAEDYARKFYGGKAEPEDGGYHFFGGEISVRVNSWQFISEEHFNTLTQYL